MHPERLRKLLAVRAGSNRTSLKPVQKLRFSLHDVSCRVPGLLRVWKQQSDIGAGM